MEGSSIKVKGFMVMDNRVLTAQEVGVSRLSGNGKNKIKILTSKKRELVIILLKVL